VTLKQQSLTLRQIAELAGTSKSTVSRVLTKHPSVSPATRERIETVMREHGFQPNLFARGLAGGRTGLVAVLASEITSGFFAEVLHGIDEVAQSHEGHLLSCIAHGTEDYISLWRSFAKRGRVDGIVLLAPPMQIFEHPVLKDDVPVILCAARADKGKKGWGSVDSVNVNNDRAMADVCDHLLQNGKKHLVHIAGPRDVYDARERRKSFQRHTRGRAGVKADILQGGLSREDGQQTIANYLAKDNDMPDALLAFNDSTAYGILEGLREQKIAVPKTVAVTGCDDEPASAILGLTSLYMPMREIGREAGRLLFDRLSASGASERARHSVLDLNLVVRTSSTSKGKHAKS